MRKLIVCLLAFILVLSIVPLQAAFAIDHPSCIVYGTVTKDVVPGIKWQKYNLAGEDKELPFEVNGNYTIDLWDIVFSKPVYNDTFTVTKGDEDTFEKRVDSNGIIYYYMKNVLSAQTESSEAIMIESDLNIPVSKDTMLLLAAELISFNMGDFESTTVFRFLIEFQTVSEKRALIIGFYGNEIKGDWYRDIESTATWGDVPKICFYGKDTPKYIFVQIPLEDTFNSILGTNIDLESITKVEIDLTVLNSTTIDSGEYIEAAFRYIIFSENKIYIANENYLLNQTTATMEIPSTIGDEINIYGLPSDVNCSKFADVQIPFKYEVEPEIDLDPDNLKMAYRWSFILPESDELSYSNTELNLTLNKDGSAYDYLYVKGSDMLSSILDKKAGTEVTLASALTPGDQYDVELKVTYTADEYDALTEAPIFWYNPVAWIMYKFWELCITIASVLGFSTAWAIKRKRALRRVKR